MIAIHIWHSKDSASLDLLEAKLAQRPAKQAQTSYCAGLLDYGDAQGAPAPERSRSSIYPVAAPSIASYFAGLLDYGDE